MSRIVCVHGIHQEYESRETLLALWVPALCGGVSNAGGRLDPAEIDMAFYGKFFRPQEGNAVTKGGKEAIPSYAPGDLDNRFEIEFLRSLYEGSMSKNSDAETMKSGIARSTAAMLQAMAKTPFFGDVAQNVVIWYLKQVSKYITNPTVKAAARTVVLNAVRDDTRVLVAHSLGSVIAWETLCANPYLPIRTLITLGSPLGVPALLPRLDPPVNPPGQWPEEVTHWINIADGTDLVALEKHLSNVFGRKVEDYLVENGATMHNIRPYLTSLELGGAIIGALKRP